jgi:hypothetical protein
VNLANTRDHLASGLDRMAGVRIYAYRPDVVKVRDGWLVLRSVTPFTFATTSATFDLIVVLSTDEVAAQQSLDDLSVDLLDHVAKCDANATGLTPVSMTIGGAELYCAAVSLLVEVES